MNTTAGSLIATINQHRAQTLRTAAQTMRQCTEQTQERAIKLQRQVRSVAAWRKRQTDAS